MLNPFHRNVNGYINKCWRLRGGWGAGILTGVGGGRMSRAIRGVKKGFLFRGRRLSQHEKGEGYSAKKINRKGRDAESKKTPKIFPQNTHKKAATPQRDKIPRFGKRGHREWGKERGTANQG